MQLFMFQAVPIRYARVYNRFLESALNFNNGLQHAWS